MNKKNVNTEEIEHSAGMAPHRLVALADAIFAFAMTLLVISLNMPEPGKIVDIAEFLLNQYATFWNFVLSFLLLILFWINFNQQFNHIKKIDSAAIFVNVFILLFVVLVPFSTSLMSDYPRNISAEAFFNGNMFILFSLFAFNWHYCYRGGFIETKFNREHIKKLNRRVIYPPIIALVALSLSFIIPGYSTLAYLAIPFLLIISSLRKK